MKTDYISVIYSQRRAPESGYPQKLVEYLKDRFSLKPGEKLLEIGCARGDFLKAFSAAGFECHGIDREEIAKELSPNLDIRICDIENEILPFENNYFDIIYHKSLIEHLYSPKHLMQETHRVLKKGGKVIILTPDWISQMRNFYEDITHCRPYDVTALRDTLTMYGFRDIISERFHQLPILWKVKPLKIFSSILRFFLNTHSARYLAQKTKIKFIRWSVELMVLGYGKK